MLKKYDVQKKNHACAIQKVLMWKKAHGPFEHKEERVEDEVEIVLQTPVHMQKVGDRYPQNEVDYQEFEWVHEIVHEKVEEKKCVAHQLAWQ